MKTHPCSRCRRLLPSAQIADTCSACRAKVKARRDKNLMRTSGDGDDKKIENHENIHANANAPGRKLHVAKKVFRKDTVNNSSVSIYDIFTYGRPSLPSLGHSTSSPAYPTGPNTRHQKHSTPTCPHLHIVVLKRHTLSSPQHRPQ